MALLPRRGLLTAAGLAAVLPVRAGAQDEPAWQPLYLVGSNMTVLCDVGGERVTATLDSGSVNSLVDAALARRLGLKLLGEVRLDAWGRKVTARRGSPLTFSLGGAVETISPVVMDYDDGRARSERPPDLILGWDVFSAWTIDFDFPASRVRFLDRRTPLTPAGRPLAIEITPQRTAILPIVVEGHPTSAMIDLGGGDGLSVPPAFARSAGLLDGRPISAWVGGAIDGQYGYQVATLRELSLAGARLHDVPVRVVRDLKTPWPVLGLEAFTRFRMTCDFAGARLWLQPDEAAMTRPFPKQRAGLAFQPRADGLRIVFVAPGSPAALTGFKAGEVVLTINGRPTGRMTALGGRAGQAFALKLTTGETRVVTLADYY